MGKKIVLMEDEIQWKYNLYKLLLYIKCSTNICVEFPTVVVTRAEIYKGWTEQSKDLFIDFPIDLQVLTGING